MFSHVSPWIIVIGSIAAAFGVTTLFMSFQTDVSPLERRLFSIGFAVQLIAGTFGAAILTAYIYGPPPMQIMEPVASVLRALNLPDRPI